MKYKINIQENCGKRREKRGKKYVYHIENEEKVNIKDKRQFIVIIQSYFDVK